MSTIKKLEQIISLSEQMLENAPKGTLFIKNINGIDRYYYGESSKSATYLGNNKTETIRKLQEKNYYKELKKTAETELETLKKIKKLKSKIKSVEKVYFDIPKNKRTLIKPYIPAEIEEAQKKIEKELKLWEKEKLIRRGIPKDLNLITLNGERVRSKSELIIADRLKNAGVPYYYEGKYVFVDDEINSTKYFYESEFDVFFPDFKVLNTRTGELLFWEHFGLMDNPEYCDSAQFKIETYAKHGFVMGKNLIISMESSKHSLNIKYIDKLIETYLK